MRTIMPGETIQINFATLDTTGAPVTLSSGATVVKRSNSDTTFTTGMTLTLDKRVAGGTALTGHHVVDIVTTDQSKYIPGYDYEVYISAGTAASISKVGVPVGMFRIADPIRYGILDSGIAAAVTASTIDLRSGHGLTSNHMPCTIVVWNATTGSKSKQTRTGTSISSDTLTIDPNWTTTPDGAGTVLSYDVYATPPSTTAQEARLAELDQANLPADVAAIGTAGGITRSRADSV